MLIADIGLFHETDGYQYGVEVGKSDLHQSCCMFTINILTVFEFRVAFSRFLSIPELA